MAHGLFISYLPREGRREGGCKAVGGRVEGVGDGLVGSRTNMTILTAGLLDLEQ